MAADQRSADREDASPRDLEDGHFAEIDVYAGDLAGLTMIDVEFGSEAAAERFRPPVWFGREITDDPRYRNRRLARDGVL